LGSSSRAFRAGCTRPSGAGFQRAWRNIVSTLHPALEIVDLEKVGDKGTVTTAVTIYNQRNELVLSGQHKYLLKS